MCASFGVRRSVKKECENCPNCAQGRNLAEQPRWFKVQRTSPHDSVFCTMPSQRSSPAGECGEVLTNRVAPPVENVKKGVKKRKSSKKKSLELPKVSHKSVKNNVSQTQSLTCKKGPRQPKITPSGDPGGASAM